MLGAAVLAAARRGAAARGARVGMARTARRLGGAALASAAAGGAAGARPVETGHPAAPLQRLDSGVAQGEPARTSLSFTVAHRPGALEDVLRQFWKNDLNLTRIESRPCTFDASKFEFYVDFEGETSDPMVQKLLKELGRTCSNMTVSGPKSVPWFPRHVRDLDSFSQKTLDAGGELESDHPGFSDKVYRARRAAIVSNAGSYKFGQEIPRVEYSAEEVRTWGVVYDKLTALYPTYACNEFNGILGALQSEAGYGNDRIPQLEDVSRFLQQRTGFRLRPVAGLLSARDFLNALAFRTFFSTQYIRHHSMPLYTPEPDVVHELMGHAPLLADPHFAELSQQYGLASLGASDRDIARLATCYWFTIEFGLYREEGAVKAYGAGLLSSFGELEWSCRLKAPGDKGPAYLPWDPVVAAETAYPITTMQPKYFVADSLRDAGDRLKEFSQTHIVRPFHVTYLPYSQSIHCDRQIKRMNYPK
jgi:phenylalanine-4-hydroxylase